MRNVDKKHKGVTEPFALAKSSQISKEKGLLGSEHSGDVFI